MPMLVFFFAIIVISRVIARALSVGFAFSFLEVNFLPMLVFIFPIIVISRVIARALSVGFAFSFLEVNFLPMLVFFFAIIILSRVIARRRAAWQRRQLRGRRRARLGSGRRRLAII